MTANCPTCGQCIRNSLPTAPPREDRPLLIDGKRIALTDLEGDLFALIYNARGGVVLRTEMHCAIYGVRLDGGPDPKIFDTVVFNLRRKLVGTAFRIITHKGVGYGLQRVPLRKEPEATLTSRRAA